MPAFHLREFYLYIVYRMQASCVFADESTLIVFCPYCSKLHKHGSGVVGPRVAHCHRGEYIVGGVFSDQFIEQAFKQHQKKLEARRKKVTPKYCDMCSTYDEEEKEVRPLYGQIGRYYSSGSTIPCPGCAPGYSPGSRPGGGQN